MKLFTAIDVPEPAAKELERQTNDLRKDYPYFNWIPLKNYHITLFYIGEVDETKVERIIERIEETIYDIDSTHIFTYGLDLFIHQKIILYAFLQRNKAIEALSKRIENVFATQESHSNNKGEYLPHITLARYKIPSKQQYFHLKKKLELTELNIDWPVKSFNLYESKAGRNHPTYEKIHTFELY